MSSLSISQNCVSVAVKMCHKTESLMQSKHITKLCFFAVKYVGVVGISLATASAIVGTSILGMFQNTFRDTILNLRTFTIS